MLKAFDVSAEATIANQQYWRIEIMRTSKQWGDWFILDSRFA